MAPKTEKVYSAAQREAITTFGKNIYVLAGAGSGKTTVLVGRFLHAVLEKNTDPDKILAITFTERAANQMKENLVREFEKRNLRDLRRSLENAYIGTIHGFCARVLRENPVESGIDPFFQVLSQGEADILMEKVMDAIFEEESRNAIWLKVLLDFKEDGVRKAFKELYDLGRSHAEDPSLWECRTYDAEKKKTLAELLPFLKEITVVTSQKSSVAYEQARNAAEDLRKLFNASTEDSPQKIDRIISLGARLTTKAREAKSVIQRVRELLSQYAAFAFQATNLPSKKEFLRIFFSFRERYDAEKNKIASYDFEDLLFKTYRLLSGEGSFQKEVRARTRALFAAILVDEHQDTNPLQARIIELLRNDDNLFFVGDVQQSIYGFRGARPEIFQRQIEDGTKDCSGKKIILSDNYRSRPEILDFVNAVSRRVLTDFKYESLQPAPTQVFDPPKHSALEILCIFQGEGKVTDIEQARVAEARAIASRIRALTDAGLRYKDIAILFRTASFAYLYEKELSDLRIPTFSYKGEGFYEKQEVMDILSCLKIIENPQADIELATVLRSPLVRISEDALFWLAHYAKKKSGDLPLWSALGDLGRIQELSGEDRRRLLHFLEWFEALGLRRSSLVLSEIIREIFEQTHYEAKVLAGPEGRQKLANLQKLLQMSRVLSEKRIFGIDDFVKFLKRLSEGGTMEPEARVVTSGLDAVMLSTVHGAKGLEFPCVIVADMGSRPKNENSRSFYTSPETGFGVKIKNRNEKKEVIGDFAFKEILTAEKRRENAESRRLLYVAMTRAMDRLILSGSIKIGKPKDADEESGEGGGKSAPWMKLIADVLGFDAGTEGPINFEGIKISLLKPAGEAAPPAKRPSFLADQAPFARALEKKEPLAAGQLDAALGAEVDWTPLRDFTDKLEVSPREHEESHDHTVTDLLEAFWEEQDYDTSSEPRDETAEESVLPRNEYGTIFHKAMEHLAEKKPAHLTPSFFLAASLSALENSQKKELQQSVEEFWDGLWGRLVRTSKRCYPELPFIYKTRFGILKGQIDLVFQSKEGEWFILDYKTNRISRSEKEAVAKRYEMQLGLYALIFKELYGATPKKGILYFSSIAEPYEFVYQEKCFARYKENLELYFKKLAHGSTISS